VARLLLLHIRQYRRDTEEQPLKLTSIICSHSSIFKRNGDIVRNETEAYNARRRAVEENIAGLRRGLALADQEISMTEPMVARGLISDLELLRMKRQANDSVSRSPNAPTVIGPR
jgi:adhesin transport system membrane fusion protein